MNLFEKIYQEVISEAFAYAHQTNIASKLQKGQEAENYFKKVANFNGYNFQIASAHQETVDHIDGILSSPYTNKKYGVEIKSKKEGCAANYFLVELRTKQNLESTGWVYRKADYIAYEYQNPSVIYPFHQNIFILINREKLKDITEKMTGAKWGISSEGKRTLIFDKTKLVDNYCDAVAPYLYQANRPEDQISIITLLPVANTLGQLQKNKDFFVIKFIESKNIRELKEKGEPEFERYKMKLL